MLSLTHATASWSFFPRNLVYELVYILRGGGERERERGRREGIEGIEGRVSIPFAQACNSKASTTYSCVALHSYVTPFLQQMMHSRECL